MVATIGIACARLPQAFVMELIYAIVSGCAVGAPVLIYLAKTKFSGRPSDVAAASQETSTIAF